MNINGMKHVDKKTTIRIINFNLNEKNSTPGMKPMINKSPKAGIKYGLNIPEISCAEYFAIFSFIAGKYMKEKVGCKEITSDKRQITTCKQKNRNS
jgi:hypothetical protein